MRSARRVAVFAQHDVPGNFRVAVHADAGLGRLEFHSISRFLGGPMAVNIKSPSSDIAGTGNGGKPTDKGGEFNGEPGYQKRTPGAGGPDQRTYDSVKPKGGLDVKTPAN